MERTTTATAKNGSRSTRRAEVGIVGDIGPGEAPVVDMGAHEALGPWVDSDVPRVQVALEVMATEAHPQALP